MSFEKVLIVAMKNLTRNPSKSTCHFQSFANPQKFLGWSIWITVNPKKKGETIDWMRSINALIVYLVIHCGSHKNDADALSLLPEFYDSFSHNSIASQCLKITQNVAFHNSILAFSTNFWSYYKVTCLVTLLDCHFQLCKNSPTWTIFVHF